MASLSEGQRRLVSVMSAFVGKPSVVLLDEPTADVDMPTKEIIWKAISNLKGHCVYRVPVTKPD